MNTELLDIDTVLAEPLAAARKAPRSIGFIGLDIPEDLLATPRYTAVHLPWQRSEATPRADAWLEDAFPGWARAIIEDWADGLFEFLDAVIFSRGDDVSQRLYYYVCELQRQGRLKGPAPLVFDVARIPRASSADWTLQAINTLAAELGLSSGDLAEGITVANRRRALLQSLDAEVQLEGRYRERVARASLFTGVESFQLDRMPRLAQERKGVVLAGSVPPDDGLHLAVEAVEWNVVADVHARDLNRLGNPVEEGDESPALRIAQRAHSGPFGPRSFHDRAAAITATVKERGADAAILWLFKEDEAFAWDVVGTRRQLEAAGIPTLVLDQRRWDLSDAPDDEIAGFLRGVQL
jgi:hypothetical protein